MRNGVLEREARQVEHHRKFVTQDNRGTVFGRTLGLESEGTEELKMPDGSEARNVSDVHHEDGVDTLTVQRSGSMCHVPHRDKQ